MAVMIRMYILMVILTPHVNCFINLIRNIGKKPNREAWHGVFDGKSRFIPWDDFNHFPWQVKDSLMVDHISPSINGSATSVPSGDKTPDWRLPERPRPPHNPDETYYNEAGRYYRIMPNHILNWMWWRGHEKPEMMMCYCVTVYKKFIPLGMGAVITYRNILTTALSTDMVVSKYRSRKTLENILGAWYNTDRMWIATAFWKKDIIATNSSLYMTPARIIYHTRWSAPEMVNRSHPIPCVFDLALWTSTKRFYYDPYYWFGVINMNIYPYYGYVTPLCNRWSNYKGAAWMPDYGSDLVFVVGCQMVMDIDRRPFPWFKYAMRFHAGAGKLNPCPKTDWEWFLCIECYGPNMRFGAEPGAALHIVTPKSSWRYKGLGGLNSFAMKLRSTHFVNYFTLLDRHPVLDWLYDAIKGLLKPDYLDFRFEALHNSAIRVRPTGGTWVNEGHDEIVDYANFVVWLKWEGSVGFTANYVPIWWR